MSRAQATKSWRGSEIINSLKNKGIIIKGHSLAGVAEESPGAYKNVDEIVNVMHNAGIAMKVVDVKPLISIKG